MNALNIEVLEIRLLPPGRALKAFVDIKINGMILREWRVIKDNGKRAWIAPPQISWKASDGTIQYKTVCTLPNEQKGEIDFAILKRFNEEMEKVNAHR